MRANTRMWSPLDNWPEEGRGERRGPTRGCGVHLTIGRPKLRVGRVFTCRTRHSTIYSRVVRAICLYAKIGQSPVNIGRLSIGLLSAIHLSSSSVNSSPVSRLEQGARTRGRAGGEEPIGEKILPAYLSRVWAVLVRRSSRPCVLARLLRLAGLSHRRLGQLRLQRVDPHVLRAGQDPEPAMTAVGGCKCGPF